MRRASSRYCTSSNGESSVPSSSMPTEKSLQRPRPRQEEAPACHARRSTGTNCTTSPSRRTRKCDDTFRAWISAKYGCAAGSRRLVNRRSMCSPPYSPGGRLIECSTTRLISAPAGRSSWLGESTILIRNREPLHPVAQLPEGDAEELRRRGAVELGLGERLEDRLALDLVEVLRQRIGRGAALLERALRGLGGE